MQKNNETFAKVEGDLLLTVKVHYCTNMILISQYKVTVLEEDYIVQQGQVETLRDHLILDAELRRGGIFTNGKFFYWTFPNQKCMLEKIRTMKPLPKLRGTYY